MKVATEVTGLNATADSVVTNGAGADRLLLRATVAWFVVTFLRPQDIVPFLRFLFPGLLATCVIAWAVAPRLGEVNWRDAPVRAYAVFLLVVVSGVAFAVNSYWLLQAFLSLISYGLVFFVALPILLKRSYCSEIIVNALLVSVLVTALWGVTHGGRGQGAWLGDENDIALFLNTGTCFGYVYWRAAPPGKRRLFFLVTTGVCVIATIASFSRGGFIGLVVAVLGIGLFSRRVIRVTVVGSLIMLAAMPFLAGLQPPEGRGKHRSYLDEIASIENQDDSTRMARIYTWTGGWVMFKSNPILGIGAGSYPFTLGAYESDPELVPLNTFGRSFAGRAAHSLYFTLLPEVGSVGTAAFLVMWITAFRRSWRIARSPNDHPLKVLASGLGAALLSFSVCSAFVSALYYPLIWLFFGMACAMRAEPGDVPVSSVGAAASADRPQLPP